MEIVSGKYTLGQRLPSVRELALALKVNPNTMQKALAELEDEKLIYTERTNGKYVTTDESLITNIKHQLAQEQVDHYLQNMQNIGLDYAAAIKYLQELGGRE